MISLAQVVEILQIALKEWACFRFEAKGRAEWVSKARHMLAYLFFFFFSLRPLLLLHNDNVVHAHLFLFSLGLFFKEHNMHRPNSDLKEDVVWVNIVV